MSDVRATGVWLPDVQIFHDLGSQLPYSSRLCNTTLGRLAREERCAYSSSPFGNREQQLPRMCVLVRECSQHDEK